MINTCFLTHQSYTDTLFKIDDIQKNIYVPKYSLGTKHSLEVIVNDNLWEKSKKKDWTIDTDTYLIARIIEDKWSWIWRF